MSLEPISTSFSVQYLYTHNHLLMRKAILCFLKRDDEILLVHTDYGHKIVWNGVSGYIDEGENATQAALREMHEEIGIEVDEHNLHSIGHHEIFEIFILENRKGEPQPKEESIKEVRWFPKSELPWAQMHIGNKEWLPEFLELIV